MVPEPQNTLDDLSFIFFQLIKIYIQEPVFYSVVQKIRIVLIEQVFFDDFLVIFKV